MTVQETARAILDWYRGDERRWCQCAYAMTAGNVITRVRDPEAVKWCVSGVCILVRVTDSELNDLSKRISGENIPTFNDRPGRTFAEVVAKLEEIANG